MRENYQPEILYEDNHILVVLKEQNLASCPDESGDENLLDLLKDYLKRTYDKPGNVYLGLVHRLDRPTGGVMVFAKTSKAAGRLAEQMKTGDFEKRYLTVLNGAPSPESGKLVNYLKKNTINNMVYLSTEGTDGAKYAALDYRVLEKRGGLALTEVKLHTGRSHQIRVQFAGIAHPVYGDMRYGGEFAIKGRLALWAYSLAFTHPVTKERMRFLSEPPAEETPWKFFSLSEFVKPV
ncbi:MAG TPA: RluA family pseudouridine synthase [Candidatus Gallimonas intestinigallinarum]|uniref:RNA pseudouridylate synthase n=1 Tax=Candidatus Gallimonas intestinigallinarum TaxID=2838604 RepID=A0A9D2DX24_9FIRM|nr:RluA family pseudouridine synthase [Candidatus Gallimonas intestinigallinarum]